MCQYLRVHKYSEYENVAISIGSRMRMCKCRSLAIWKDVVVLYQRVFRNENSIIMRIIKKIP